MNKKYVVKTHTTTSKGMSREEAIEKVKKFAHEKIDAYIISEDEAERILNKNMNTPKWK